MGKIGAMAEVWEKRAGVEELETSGAIRGLKAPGPATFVVQSEPAQIDGRGDGSRCVPA